VSIIWPANAVREGWPGADASLGYDETAEAQAQGADVWRALESLLRLVSSSAKVRDTDVGQLFTYTTLVRICGAGQGSVRVSSGVSSRSGFRSGDSTQCVLAGTRTLRSHQVLRPFCRPCKCLTIAGMWCCAAAFDSVCVDVVLRLEIWPCDSG